MRSLDALRAAGELYVLDSAGEGSWCMFMVPDTGRVVAVCESESVKDRVPVRRVSRWGRLQFVGCGISGCVKASRYTKTVVRSSRLCPHSIRFHQCSTTRPRSSHLSPPVSILRTIKVIS